MESPPQGSRTQFQRQSPRTHRGVSPKLGRAAEAPRSVPRGGRAAASSSSPARAPLEKHPAGRVPGPGGQRQGAPGLALRGTGTQGTEGSGGGGRALRGRAETQGTEKVPPALFPVTEDSLSAGLECTPDPAWVTLRVCLSLPRAALLSLPSLHPLAGSCGLGARGRAAMEVCVCSCYLLPSLTVQKLLAHTFSSTNCCCSAYSPLTDLPPES